MPLTRRKSVTAGELASELASAEERLTETIQAANAAWRESRQSVLDRGSQRAYELQRLEQEAREEREAIEAVLPKQ
jgi:hypothetical protein